MTDMSDAAWRPLITAHRGASAEYPENTMAAFDAGLRAGADASECDVHRSGDGELMVIHDDTVDRTTDGSGPVSQMTADELAGLDAGGYMGRKFAGEQIPRLEDVIELHKNRAQLIIEIKDYGCTEDVLECIADLNAARDVSVCSFSFDECVRARRQAPEIPAAFIYAGQDERMDAGALVEKVLRGNVNILSVHHTLVQPALLNECRLRGVALWAWTVDDPARVRDLAAMGVGNIVSNRPGMALEIVRGGE